MLTVTDQEAYRRYTAKTEELLAESEGKGLSPDQVTAYGLVAGAWATLALAAAQERVQPAERPIEGNGLEVGFIVVDNEMVKPTDAAYEHQVVMRDDRGRRWRVAAGTDGLYWEAVQG